MIILYDLTTWRGFSHWCLDQGIEKIIEDMRKKEKRGVIWMGVDYARA